MRKLVLCLVAILFSGCVTTKSFNAFKAGNSRDLEQLQANQENLRKHIAVTQRIVSKEVRRIDQHMMILLEMLHNVVAEIRDINERARTLREEDVASLEALVAQLWKNQGDMKNQIATLRQRFKKMEDDVEGIRIEKNTPEKPVKK